MAGLGASEPGGSYPGAEIVGFVLPSDGLYSVHVEGKPGDGRQVEYRLAVLRAQNPVVASMKTAHGIAYSQPQSGVLTSSPAYQAWVFFGQAGERVGCVVHPLSTSFAPAVYLIGPGGGILLANASSIAGTDVTLPDFTLPDDGFYGLVAGSASPEQLTGEAEYTILVQQIAAGALNQGVLAGEASGKLTDAAPVHQWTLAPAYSGDFLVQVQAAATGRKLDLFVLSADATVLANGVPSAQDDTRAVVKLEAGRLYTAVVSGGPATGQVQYSVRLMPASVATSGLTIAGAAPNIGRLGDQHPADEWRLEGTSGQMLSVQVTRVSGDLIPVVAVLDENGTVIGQSAAGDDGVLALAVQLPTDGTYHLLVSRAESTSGGTSGDYTIALGPG